MFLNKLLFVSSMVIILFSCTSIDRVTVAEPETVEIETTEIETTEIETTEIPAPSETILSELLIWASPSFYQITLEKSTVLPIVPLREIKKEAEVEVAETVSMPAILTKPVQVESKSFLELLFTEKEKPEKIIENTIETPPVKVEPAVIMEKESVTSAVIKPSAAITVKLEPELKTAAVREVFLMTLSGEGWMLESFTDYDGNQTDKLKYNGREYIGGNTLFSFYPYSTGLYVINLRKSDYSEGTTERKTVELEVLTILDDEPQSIQMTEEEAEPVIALPVENVEPAEPETVTEVLFAVDSLEAAGDCKGAAALLERNVVAASSSELDEFYFRLGGLYENCPAVRDERSAVAAYKKIVDYYPVSIYWIEAKARIKYLERNFIHIR